MSNATPDSFVVLALVFLGSTILGAVLTHQVRGLARRRGWVLFPASHHIHKHGVPRLGGIAVYSTFLLVYIIGALANLNPSWRHELSIVIAASLLFAVGLVDDLRVLSARIKLAFQVLSGVIVYSGGMHFFNPQSEALSFLPPSICIIVSFIATVSWIVFITNALNLIDGLDGLAAGAALFSIVTLFGLAIAGHDQSIVFSCLVLGGAVLGFLRYNFSPATIFLGDGGSLFIGVMLSGMALQPARAAASTAVALAIPLVSFGLPIVETCVSIIRRFLSGKQIFSPDTEHIHHRLLQLGLTHRQAVIALYGVCAICAMLSLVLIYPGRAVVGLILIVVGMIAYFGIRRLGYPEFDEISRVAQRALEQRQIISNNVVIRRAARMLRSAHSRSDIVKALDRVLAIGEFDAYTLLSSEIDIRRELRGNVPTDSEIEISEGPAGWGVTVDLTSDEEGKLGHLSFGRAFRRRSVLVDVNLLFSELEPSLTEACLRVQRRQVTAYARSRRQTTRALSDEQHSAAASKAYTN